MIPKRLATVSLACAAAAGAAVLASAAPSQAAAAPAAITKFSAVRPNTVYFGNCGEGFLFTQPTHIRSAAGTYNPVIGLGQAGQWFVAEEETSYYYSGYRWVEGTDLDTDVSGWVAVELLTDMGPAGCTFLS